MFMQSVLEGSEGGA